MRVIAGEYRRRTLRTPAGMATRPTSDRLRETLFNVLAPRLEGAWFLDLYAGSGANGIEALSRGAERAVFVEQAPPAVGAIRANLAELRVEARRYTVEARKVASWLESGIQTKIQTGLQRASTTSGSDRGFDVVFLDPPYDDAGAYTETLSLIGRNTGALLNEAAVVIAEHRRVRRNSPESTLVERYGSLERVRLLEQGDGALSFYTLKPE